MREMACVAVPSALMVIIQFFCILAQVKRCFSNGLWLLKVSYGLRYIEKLKGKQAIYALLYVLFSPRPALLTLVYLMYLQVGFIEDSS